MIYNLCRIKGRELIARQLFLNKSFFHFTLFLAYIMSNVSSNFQISEWNWPQSCHKMYRRLLTFLLIFFPLKVRQSRRALQEPFECILCVSAHSQRGPFLSFSPRRSRESSSSCVSPITNCNFISRIVIGKNLLILFNWCLQEWSPLILYIYHMWSWDEFAPLGIGGVHRECAC